MSEVVKEQNNKPVDLEAKEAALKTDEVVVGDPVPLNAIVEQEDEHEDVYPPVTVSVAEGFDDMYRLGEVPFRIAVLLEPDVRAIFAVGIPPEDPRRQLFGIDLTDGAFYDMKAPYEFGEKLFVANLEADGTISEEDINKLYRLYLV